MRRARAFDGAELAATGDALVDAIAQRVHVQPEPILEARAQRRHGIRGGRVVDPVVPLAGVVESELGGVAAGLASGAWALAVASHPLAARAANESPKVVILCKAKLLSLCVGGQRVAEPQS